LISTTNILIIFCHPARHSYTCEVLEQLKNELQQRNYTIEISDLYAINFKSDITEEEYTRESTGGIELPVAADVREEHRKIEGADCIIFLYPVWWSDCPAKLKGWFDRVFTVGYAYKHQDGYPKMKTIPYGLAFCTAGYSNDFLIKTGIAQSMETIMLDDRLGKRFEHKEMIILGGTLNADEVRKKHLEQIIQAVNKMEMVLLQMMPG
jgi:NAD(P)H dehydrogenase (quinone)